MTVEQVRRLKDLVESELERQDPVQDREYIEELEAMLVSLSFLDTKE